MKSNFKFSNLCGTVYQQGNVVFTPDSHKLLSPVGNRVSVFDLLNNKSWTFSFENRKNIAVIALSPDSNVLISVDEDGRALLVNFRRDVVLHHFNFHKPVRDIKFSPDGKYIAVTHGAHVQVWNTPNHLVREFAPFVLHRTYTGHHDDVLTIQWSPDSQCFLTTSRDMTARLFTLNPLEGFRPKTFSGHKDSVVAAYFSQNGQTIYTISRDGALFVWRAKEPEDAMDSDEDEAPAGPIASTSNGPLYEYIANTRWGIKERHYFNQQNTRIVCTTYHPGSNILIAGFSTGIFGIWELPTFNNIHTLSISQEKISSVAINSSGEWLAFGAKKLGQLLVWEWQSESYVLKQQGHYFDMNTLSYAPDGQVIVTGGDDGKVKVWSTHSGFCFVTFSEHSAPVSSVMFAQHGNVVFSASLDGTVRAYDLIRYRNFRTFTSPSPVQFSCLAVDPSGEVIAAGSTDSFEIFLWSVQTGKLLDILAGHTGPVSALAFSPSGANQLMSCSWDRSVRVWNIFTRANRQVESFDLNSDALALAIRPDGKELAVATLDGQIAFFNTDESKQTNIIVGRADIAGGRKSTDRVTAANAASGKAFTSLAYAADGRCLLAGGNSKYVCLYDVRAGTLLRKFQISQNLSLDGTEEFLDSRRLNDAGVNADLIDRRGEESDLEDRLDGTLPGAQRNTGTGASGRDAAVRRTKQEARTKSVRFAPTGRAWAAASTEGLLVYSLDAALLFDPFDLSLALTPAEILRTLEEEREYFKALIMALRFSDPALIRTVYERVPVGDIKLIVRQLPTGYLEMLIRFIGERLDGSGGGSGSGSGSGAVGGSPHLEFDLVWVNMVLVCHGRWLRDRNGEYASVLRLVQKGLKECEDAVVKLCDENKSTLAYLLDQQKLRTRLQQREEADSAMAMEITA